MKTSNILSTSTFTRRIRLAALLVTISTCLAAQAEITIEKRGNPTWEPTGAFISSLESPDIADLSSKQGERLLFSEVLANSHVIQDNFEFGYLPTEAHGGPYGREFQEAVAAFGGIDTDVVLSSDVREPNSIFRGITLVPSNNAPEGSSFPHGDEVPVIPNDIFPIKVSYDQETYNGRVVLSDKELEIPALTDYGVITDLDGNERDYTGFSWTHIHLPWGVFWPSDRSLDRIPGNYEGVFRYRDRENNGWDVTFSYTAKSPTGILGDLDYDSLFSMGDLSVLAHNVALGSTNDRLDLNEDGNVDTGDVHFWVTDLYETSIGDSNLDDEVNFEDFLALSDNFGQPGSWEDGDFNADGLVQFADFLLLSDNFGHGTDVATQSVPEPNSTSLLILGLIGLSRFRRRSACVQSTSSKSSISARQSIQAERCFANLDHSCPAYFVCLLLLGAFPTVCLSQIERREYGEGVVTRMVIPGTEDITPGPNVDLSGWNTDDRNLRGANLSADWLPYREGEVFDLSGANFGKSW